MAVAERCFGPFANKTFAKGKLKIHPMGQVAHVKEVKANMILIHCPDDSKPQIIPPKVDLGKKTGALVQFFHLVKSPGGNMEVHMTKAENGFQVPILRNNSKVEPGTFLTMLCSEDEMAITRMWSISWNGYATTIPEDLLKEYQDV